MTRVRITSGGTAQTTQVFIDGKPVGNVTRVEILPIEPDQEVRAVITFIGVALDVEAQGVALPVMQ